MKKSEFTGGLLGLVGINVLSFLMVLFTLGIALPFAVTVKEKWYAEHTIIEGKQLKFIGNGISLFGNWIKWFLLCIITIGIYSFWVSIKMKQWVIKNTIFE